MMNRQTEVLASIKKLPTFSPTMVQLAQLVNDPDAGLGEYEAVVQVDMALTASLLRMANSAYFGFSRKIGNVREAIALLGVRRLFQLGAMAALDSVVPSTMPGYGTDSTAFWCHSVAVAILAERISKERKLAPPQLSFTTGLLHDIGKLAVSCYMAGRIPDLQVGLSEKNKTHTEREMEWIGADHAAIGAELALTWNLPDDVVRVIARHHTLQVDEVENTGDILAYLVHAADTLSYSIGYGADPQISKPHVDEKALTRLGLRVADLQHAADHALPEIEGFAQIGRRNREERK